MITTPQDHLTGYHYDPLSFSAPGSRGLEGLGSRVQEVQRARGLRGPRGQGGIIDERSGLVCVISPKVAEFARLCNLRL